MAFEGIAHGVAYDTPVGVSRHIEVVHHAEILAFEIHTAVDKLREGVEVSGGANQIWVGLCAGAATETGFHHHKEVFLPSVHPAGKGYQSRAVDGGVGARHADGARHTAAPRHAVGIAYGEVAGNAVHRFIVDKIYRSSRKFCRKAVLQTGGYGIEAGNSRKTGARVSAYTQEIGGSTSQSGVVGCSCAVNVCGRTHLFVPVVVGCVDSTRTSYSRCVVATAHTVHVEVISNVCAAVAVTANTAHIIGFGADKTAVEVVLRISI